MKPAKVFIAPGKEKAVRNRNPWVYSGAVDHVDSFERNGQPAEILTAHGGFIGAGYVNPDSRIVCRVLSWKPADIDRAFLSERIHAAIGRRAAVFDAGTDSCRLVNSEGDFLPGLVVDRYGVGVVIQILTAGMEFFRGDILDILREALHPAFIVERSDVSSRLDEGLEECAGVIEGAYDGPVEIVENGHRFLVDLLRGQKTGFYLDQRESREIVGGMCAGKRVLNLFSYTGGFSVYAAAGGATEVISVDSSKPALENARENMSRNGFGDFPGDFVRSDVFKFLNDTKDVWDVIVLDPPAFASRKAQVEQAARGYKDLAMRCLRKLAPGGILATYSCSHHIDRTLFRQITFAAVVDAERDAQVIRETSHPFDHPYDICHKEGEYLKGIIVRVAR